MDQLFRNVRVVDRTSPHHGQVVDLRLSGDKIVAIGTALDADGAEVTEARGRCVAPAWVDIGAWVGDPGHEHREDVDTLVAAALRGGYSTVAVLPNTTPTLHSKSEISYIQRRAAGAAVNVLPLGALSRETKGQDLTEMIDMYRNGALAFTDGLHPVQHAGLMLRALHYVKAFGGIIINMPYEDSTAPGGMIHEGTVSTRLGMRGIPTLAETLMVERDLRLLAYTDSRLHLQNISAAETVACVRRAKADGLAVTASVPVLNLLYDHTALEDFDTNLKLLPPLRTADDRAALLAGLVDGTIDLINSNHLPQDEDSKVLEFPYADFGATALETTFAVARTALADTLDLAGLVDLLAHRPRQVFGLPPVRIAPGESAALTVFDPDEEWTVGPADLASRSRNTPLLNVRLRGRIYATYNNGQLWKR